MIKHLLLVLCIFYSASILAQPEGKLFVHTNGASINEKGKLGYVSYPGGSYVEIDSTNATDFIIIGDSIYVADGNIHIYNKTTNLLVSNIPVTDAIKLEHWNNQLIVLSNVNPYFRVYDLSTQNLIYSIDSIDITYGPTDILVSDDKAFMIQNDTVIVIDLILQIMEEKLYSTSIWIWRS